MLICEIKVEVQRVRIDKSHIVSVPVPKSETLIKPRGTNKKVKKICFLVPVYNSSCSLASSLTEGAADSVSVGTDAAEVTSPPSSGFLDEAANASTLYLPLSLMKLARSSTVLDPAYSIGESLAPAGKILMVGKPWIASGISFAVASILATVTLEASSGSSA